MNEYDTENIKNLRTTALFLSVVNCTSHHEVNFSTHSYFGTERYDDTVDALTLAVNKLIKDENQPISTAVMIKLTESPYDSVMKRSAKSNSVDLYSRSTDWADRDDEAIFRKYNMVNPHRIYE